MVLHRGLLYKSLSSLDFAVTEIIQKLFLREEANHVYKCFCFITLSPTFINIANRYDLTVTHLREYSRTFLFFY